MKKKREMIENSQIREPIFIFVHGYGSMTKDLLPLAQSMKRKGFKCISIQLSGHGPDDNALENAIYSDWYNQLKTEYKKFVAQKKKIYLVGFSLGATLAIDFATRHSVEGIIAISAFLGPTHPKLTSTVLKIANLFPKKRIKRLLQTTDKRTKEQVDYAPYLPVATTNMIIAEAKRVTNNFRDIKCRILAFHSIDDQVASYKNLIESAKSIDQNKIRIVTFRYLNHFMQFDVSPESTANFILEYFGLSRNLEENVDSSLKEIHQQCANEHNHWASILFQLIVAYFTVFGTLLFFSLKDVLLQNDSAPYYLMSYSIITSIYLLLLMLYFFYINRVSVFTKIHIEPQLRNISWNTYRTCAYASSKESEVMTQKTSFVTFFFPLIISISALSASIYQYSEKLVISTEYYFLKLSFIFAFFLLVFSVRSAIKVKKYTDRELYLVFRPAESNYRLESLLMQLYSTISPGTVSQSQCATQQNASPNHNSTPLHRGR